jgi:DNA-binding transcriptional regulator YdaS (Cro superfamily)
MDDISDGLREAIKKAGGLRALARALGISQTSLAQWRRIPADRLVQVEAVTGIDRTVLRPDLYQREK